MKNRYALSLFGIVVVLLVLSYVRAQQKGYVTVATPGVLLQVWGGFGHGMILQSESGPTEVSARAYKPTSLELRWKQGDDLWQMWCRGPWGQLSRIKIARGRTTTVELGPPLLIKPQVEVIGRQLVVDLGIFGRAGEKYTGLICKNDRRVPAPKITIVDEGGTVLDCGPAKYG